MAHKGYVLEAARAASLASHSAAGLAASAGLKEATRLLRAAESLSRAAAAQLLGLAGGSGVGSGQPTGAPPTTGGRQDGSHGGGTSRSARRRRRRHTAKAHSKDVEMKEPEQLDKDVEMEEPEQLDKASAVPVITATGPTQILDLGDSVVIGDLAELWADGSGVARATAASSAGGGAEADRIAVEEALQGMDLQGKGKGQGQKLEGRARADFLKLEGRARADFLREDNFFEEHPCCSARADCCS